MDRRSLPPVTTALIAINVAIWILCIVLSMKGGSKALFSLDNRTLILLGAKWRPEMIPGGQWWRLLTAGFLHGGLIHIALNAQALWVVGEHCEQLYGAVRYLAIYLISTATGFLLSLYYWPNLTSVGASAGIFGIIGAMIVVGWLSGTEKAQLIRSAYSRIALYSVLIGVVPPVLSWILPRWIPSWFLVMDNAAHIGGLAGGFLVALLAGFPKPEDRLRTRVWSAVAVLMVALTLFGALRVQQFYRRLAPTPAYRNL